MSKIAKYLAPYRPPVRLKSSVSTMDSIVSEILFDDAQARILELAKKFQQDRLSKKAVK